MNTIKIRTPDVSTLRRIKMTSKLHENHLIVLANRLEVFTARDKEMLISFGSTEKTSLYIIKGKVSLGARDGKTRTISVDEAQEPKVVAQLRPCIYDVSALGAVDYMKIDTQKVVDFAQLAETSVGDISVHSLFDTDDTDNAILNNLYHNLTDKSIQLPELPSVANRIQQIYKGESTDIAAMAHILIAYPDVARKIKNVARYAKKPDLRAIEKNQRSIERLGVSTVYSLVMTYAVGKLVKRLPQSHFQLVGSFWRHSLNVAAISRVLAKKTRLVSPDLAMLAGLIHGIGVLAIDDYLLQHNDLMLDHLEIEHAIQMMRPEISSLLLRKWNFDDDLILVTEECGKWSRDNEGPADLCDLVLVANYLGLMKSDRKNSLPHVDTIPAVAKLEITPEDSIEAIKEAITVRVNIQKLFS